MFSRVPLATDNRSFLQSHRGLSTLSSSSISRLIFKDFDHIENKPAGASSSSYGRTFMIESL